MSTQILANASDFKCPNTSKIRHRLRTFGAGDYVVSVRRCSVCCRITIFGDELNTALYTFCVKWHEVYQPATVHGRIIHLFSYVNDVNGIYGTQICSIDLERRQHWIAVIPNTPFPVVSVDVEGRYQITSFHSKTIATPRHQRIFRGNTVIAIKRIRAIIYAFIFAMKQRGAAGLPPELIELVATFIR